jgi:hypothetical protein
LYLCQSQMPQQGCYQLRWQSPCTLLAHASCSAVAGRPPTAVPRVPAVGTSAAWLRMCPPDARMATHQTKTVLTKKLFDQPVNKCSTWIGGEEH